MSQTPWIITKNGGPAQSTLGCHCERCGAVLPIAAPVAVAEWVAATNAFIERHKGCVEKLKFDYHTESIRQRLSFADRIFEAATEAFGPPSLLVDITDQIIRAIQCKKRHGGSLHRE